VVVLSLPVLDRPGLACNEFVFLLPTSPAIPPKNAFPPPATPPATSLGALASTSIILPPSLPNASGVGHANLLRSPGLFDKACSFSKNRFMPSDSARLWKRIAACK
jgi:hypothetical protein